MTYKPKKKNKSNVKKKKTCRIEKISWFLTMAEEETKTNKTEKTTLTLGCFGSCRLNTIREGFQTLNLERFRCIKDSLVLSDEQTETTQLPFDRLKAFFDSYPVQWWEARLSDEVHYTQTTREVVQLFKFLTGELNIPSELTLYTFGRAFGTNTPLHFGPHFKTRFESIDWFVVEICSRKMYMYTDATTNKCYYLPHHPSAASERNVFGSIQEKIQSVVLTDQDIEADMLSIVRMVACSCLFLHTFFPRKKHMYFRFTQDQCCLCHMCTHTH